MATVHIPFGNTQESGDQELAGASPLAVNLLVDGRGAVRRRPGLSAWSGFPTTIPDPTQIDGMGLFNGEVYYVNSQRRIRKVTPASATDTLLTDGSAGSYLAGTGRPVLVPTAFRVVIAGGDVPAKVDGGATVAAILGGSPPPSTQIAALSQRLFSDDITDSNTSGRIRYSGVGDGGNESWDALDYANAEADPDPIVAICGNSNELFAWGSRTLQVFSPDPSAVIATGRAQNVGCAAAASVVRSDEDFYFLDQRKRFLQLSAGRGYAEISAGIAATLDLEVATVSDCWGFRMDYDQFDCLAWVFPTDGRTFVYQHRGGAGGWSQWQGWTGGIGYTAFPAKSHLFYEDANIHLVGLASGQIARMDSTAFTDLGGIIKAECRTGFRNEGTDATKEANVLRLVLKRGQQLTTEPTIRVSWRDDLGAFCEPVVVSLGTVGDFVHTVELRGLGTFRSRQWRIDMSAAVEVTLVRAEIDITAGGD